MILRRVGSSSAGRSSLRTCAGATRRAGFTQQRGNLVREVLFLGAVQILARLHRVATRGRARGPAWPGLPRFSQYGRAPADQQHDEDKPEPAAEARAAAPAILAAAVIPEAASQPEDHQKDQQDQLTTFLFRHSRPAQRGYAGRQERKNRPG